MLCSVIPGGETEQSSAPNGVFGTGMSLQAAYDGEYLAKQLDIGMGAALATDTAARTLGRAIVGKVRQVTDKVRQQMSRVGLLAEAHF